MALSDRKQHRMAEQMKCKIYARLLLARGLTGLTGVPHTQPGTPSYFER
jgi:hypothetical protein